MVKLDAYVESEIERNNALKHFYEVAQGRKKRGERPDTCHEIIQQPWTWIESSKIAVERIPRLTDLAEEADHVCFTGAGSSVLVGRCLDYMLGARLGKPCFSIPTTDLILDPALYLPRAGKGLLVSFSRSGASSESFKAIEAVRQVFPAYQHLLITCNPEGELIQRFQDDEDFDAVALHPATCDRGLAMTSSFTSMVICGQMFAFLGNADGYLEHVQRLSDTGQDSLRKAAEVVRALLAAGTPERVCLLGSRVLLGATAEGALKLLELTEGRIPTLSESFVGVRHGPLSFVNDQTAVLFSVSTLPHIRRYERDLVKEVHDKSLGIGSIATGYGMESEYRDLVDYVVEVPPSAGEAIHDDFRPPIDVMLAQTLALGVSLQHGLDPDNPSPEGVINRVAQGVTIY
jgi:tagatose-6-phosphate ketose/aldose isomerase